MKMFLVLLVFGISSLVIANDDNVSTIANSTPAQLDTVARPSDPNVKPGQPALPVGTLVKPTQKQLRTIPKKKNGKVVSETASGDNSGQYESGPVKK